MTKQHCTCTAGGNSIFSSQVSSGGSLGISPQQLSTRHGNVSEKVSKKGSAKGIKLKAKWLQQAGFEPNSDYSILFLPGQIVITNQAHKQQRIRAIEELQHREFELGIPFCEPIRQLAESVGF